MSLALDRDVLLFFEDRDRDTFVPGDRRVRRFLRRAIAPLRRGRQTITGFEMSFLLLRKALENEGLRVHVNDMQLARRNPEFPVGICGYTHVLDRWSLPNPAVLGPGLFDHPKLRPLLMDDERFRFYVVFCDWMGDLFSTIYPREVLTPWFGGMDLADWPDTSAYEKSVDFLVYDKIRWNRDTLVPALRDPLVRELERRGLSYEILRYGAYTLSDYHLLLRRSRNMLFLCEHETQGMAYQEALASNVPVLAWDQGTWLDPNRPLWEDRAVPASSVPYFSAQCGERFEGAGDFATALDLFLANRPSYAPRAWAAEHLSLRRSAELYLQAYRAAAQAPAQRAQSLLATTPG